MANFEKYTMFEKLQAATVKDLRPGDIIRFRSPTKAEEANNHVQIWLGNGQVWESADSPRVNGVRLDYLSETTGHYNKRYGTNYTMDYFRYKGVKK